MPVKAGLTAEIERRIQALEMRCYRRLLNISYKDHVTNEEVRNRIQDAIGVHDDLLTMVKEKKLWWYGHISRSSGMAKTILQGGGGQWKEQEGEEDRKTDGKITSRNGRELGLEIPWGQRMGFGDSLRVAEDREGWKGIVATSSVVKGLWWDERNFVDGASSYLFLLLFQFYFQTS